LRCVLDTLILNHERFIFFVDFAESLTTVYEHLILGRLIINLPQLSNHLKRRNETCALLKLKKFSDLL
jgi:hypothetical protein